MSNSTTQSTIDKSTESACTVSVRFDLRQSIDTRGYTQPEEQILMAMRRAFEDCLWYEIENHWDDIVAYSGFDYRLADPDENDGETQAAAPERCYEVQHFTLCDGWVNTWRIEAEDGHGFPETFSTREAAEAALEEFFTDIAAGMAADHLAADTEHPREAYRIAEVAP